MGEILEELISGILGSAEVLVFAWGICQVRLTKDWKRWAAACVLWGLEMAVVCSGVLDEMTIFPIKFLGKMGIISILLMQGKAMPRILQYLFSTFYAAVTFRPIYFGITLLGEFVMDCSAFERIARNLASGFNICVLIMLARQIKKRKQWVSWIQSIPMKYYLLGLFCVFCANGLKSYMAWELAGLDLKNRIFWGILTNMLYLFFISLGIGFAFVNLLKERYYRESSLKSEYLRMAQEHYSELSEHMREVRRIRHDMMAHVNALEHLVSEGKIDGTLNYLHEIKREIDTTSRKAVKVGNELVNAVLEHELKKADSETSFLVEGCLPKECVISDFDMCVLFSNLLSNAVEACKRCSKYPSGIPEGAESSAGIRKGEEKYIRLEIKNWNGKLLIGMTNPVEESVSLEQLGYATSKKDQDHHGYGIYNIRKTVEKYGGDVEFQIEGGVFEARIYFYQEVK